MLRKEIKNSRMLKNTGSWLYCNKCDCTVGYLCYTTYHCFRFEFSCKCGNSGSFYLAHETDNIIERSSVALKQKKNRLCCPIDNAPLFTIVEKNIDNYSYSVTCNKCYTKFEYNNA